MERKDIKRILSAGTHNLTEGEKQIGFKITAIFISIILFFLL